VLATLWANDISMTPSQVLEGLDEGLAYTTVLTILSRLHVKGLVERERAGRAFAYRPAIDPAELAARQMRSALSLGDHAAVLQRFVEGLSDDDERLLQRLLDPRPGGT